MESPSIDRRTWLKQTAAASVATFAAARSLHAQSQNPMQTAAVPFRECYCPAHFGNSYEAMWPREMAEYLAELKWWGFNRYGDWITTTDVINPYTSDAFWDLAKEQMQRKKAAFRAAQSLGMKLNLIVTPNHVYLDQLHPDHNATKNKRVFGQLVCPSTASGRKLILDNFTRWFSDFAAEGIRLDSFTAFAYDYGGCDCAKCRPWIVTFAKLMKEIHAIAEKHHPGIEPWFCSWWWEQEEHALFNEWSDREAKGWLKGMTFHIEYGKTRFKDVMVPSGCRKLSFVHVGYSDNPAAQDIYAKWGGVCASTRLPATLRETLEQESEGFQAYSEGVFDDVNKALLAGIGSGKFSSAEEVLRAYAQRYFKATPEQSARWAAWLAQWGDRTMVPLPQAGEEFEKLAAGAPSTWRLEHWRVKLELESIHRRIGVPTAKEWTQEKLELAQHFWATQEKLLRDVYRLGPVRHIFNRKMRPPAWYGSWLKAVKSSADAGAVLPPEA